ncbi:hypothetical protein FH972_002461 [Carpinus fangiana]|uniref:Embryo sac development arrest protein n=1 Tax=Carpinus fangiana TaxID=176857 RepID=A0A5N6QEX6_9ROSI|nr:hypothetical protein FH972_002461 [Carpinus fangiana]
MNTKTMRLPPRRVLTPNATNNKRKDREREEFDALKPPPTPTTTTKLPKPDAPKAEPISPSSNQLLAGYLAHEFLNKGTLFGQLWDPVENEVVPASPKKRAKPSRNGKADEPSRGQLEDYQRYVEVASLLKTDGAHLPGIVNPTQLACFLQM